jgi:hypothetical protein
VSGPPDALRGRGGYAVTEVKEGKIVRCRDYFDRANMYEPLGLIHLLAG